MRANQLDPKYELVKANLGWWYSLRLGEGWSTDRDADRSNALKFAQEGVDDEPEDTHCRAVWAHIIAFIAGLQSEAEEQFQKAIENDPNSAFTWGVSASNLCFMGEPEQAIVRLQNAYRLSPFDRMNFFYWTVHAIAEFLAGNYAEASVWSRKALRENGRFIAAHRTLAASLAMVGDIQAAKESSAKLIELLPQFKISEFATWYPLRRPEHMNLLTKALTKAGLPS